MFVLLLAFAGCNHGRTSSSAEDPSANAASSVAAADETGPDATRVAHADSLAINVGDTQLVATLADTDAAQALAEQLQVGPVTVSLHAYGGFEKVGPLPWSLPTSDEQVTAQPGDVMLYQGNQITVLTGANNWAYTPLGRIEGATSESLIEALGDGDAVVVLSLV